MRKPQGGSIAPWVMAMAIALASDAHAAGPASVVKDVTTGTEWGVSSQPGPFFALGQATLFFASDDAHGRELWRSDGTRAGTRLLADVAPGPADGVGYVGHAADGELYFGATQRGLWRSDGTAAGTYALADIQPWRMLADGDRLYVTAAVGYDGVDLYRVDLPGGATTLLRSFRGGRIEPSLTILGDRLFFAAADAAQGLWSSDGTPAGTRLVRTVHLANDEGGNDETEMIAAGGQLFFMAQADGWELWRSDGTEAGTHRVRDIAPGPRSGLHFNDLSERAHGFFGALGDLLIFMADDGVSGLEPWRSDGTEAGTYRLADVWPGAFGVDGTDGSDDDYSDVAEGVVRVVPFSDRIFFTARAGDRRLQLWSTDGSVEQTHAVTAFDERIDYPGTVVTTAQHLFGGAYAGLWVSDGTAAGTTMIAGDVDQPSYLTPAFGGVVFNGHAQRTGYEPWVSDGTAAGTRLLADVARGLPSLDPEHLTDFAGTLLFSGDDAAHGRELWRSDGTAAGTRLVADVVPGEGGSFPADLTVSGATAYFSAGGSYRDRALWRTDGTDAGTRRIDGAVDPIALSPDGRGGVYFFSAAPSDGSFWHSDGSPPGTQLVRTGDASVWLGALDPAVVLGNATIFAVHSATHGWAVWRTDGTPDGTSLLAAPTLDVGSVHHLTRFGDVALFFAGTPRGDVLWRSDGTVAGTVPVAELAATVSGSIAAAGGRLVFTARDSLGYRLWQTDGTRRGTFRLTAERLPAPPQIAAIANRLFTLASTSRRTVLGEPGCADLAQTQSGVSSFGSLAALDDRLLFLERLPSHAARLWVSDGTRAGTVAIQDLPAPSVPGAAAEPQFVRSGGRVFFAARQGDAGRELWALPVAAVPPVRAEPCEAAPTPTPVPGRPTPSPFACPAGGAYCSVLEIEPVDGRAGERVTITAVLHASELPIAGTQNDIILPEGIAVVENDDGTPACTVDASIGKNGTVFAFQPARCAPDRGCSAIRALVLSLVDVAPIADGSVLYRCELQLSPELISGEYAVALSNLDAADPEGQAVALDGIDGVITVSSQGTRPIAGGGGGGDGCDIARPYDRPWGSAWGLLPLLLIGLRRRRR